MATNAENSTPHSGEAGAAVYSPFVLSFYDTWVLGLSNSFAWRCPTKGIQLPFFGQFIGQRHLDIGPGSGYYLKHGNIPEDTVVTLLDLNINSLLAAEKRLGRSSTLTIEADVTQPLALDGVYDSISMFYLIHCLPRPLEEKMKLLTSLKHHLAENGVVYGTTILGKDVQHNWFGRLLMKFYNSRGIFGNWQDGEKEIRQALCKDYEKVETKAVGCVLLFSASRPKYKIPGKEKLGRACHNVLTCFEIFESIEDGQIPAFQLQLNHTKSNGL